MKKLTFLLLLCLIALCNYCALAQAINADSIQAKNLYANMANVFNKAVGQQSAIYNGPAYDPNILPSKTNANFTDTTAFVNGSVIYDGVLYNNIPMIYDINRDLVVSRLYNDFSVYNLLSEKVSGFTLLGHSFIKIIPDSLDKDITEGFYDELYNGKLQLVAKRYKDIIQTSSPVAGQTWGIFVTKNSYYLKKGDLYYSVNGEGDFLNALKDKKKELKQYIKDKKMKFGRNPEYSMQVLAAYYDHLTK